MIWTDESVEELKRMWDRGMTTGQIAKALNVTKNSIIGKVHRLCLTARPSPIKKATESDGKKSSDTKGRGLKNTGQSANNSENENEKFLSSANTVVEETNIPLVKLDNHTCRWPLGDPRDDDFCFCGKKVRAGQTYCDEHAAVAYVKQGKKL